MLRFVFLALAIAVTVYIAVRLSKELANGNVDWKGVAFAAGFIFLALYLRHTTGIAGIPGLG